MPKAREFYTSRKIRSKHGERLFSGASFLFPFSLIVWQKGYRLKHNNRMLFDKILWMLTSGIRIRNDNEYRRLKNAVKDAKERSLRACAHLRMFSARALRVTAKRTAANPRTLRRAAPTSDLRCEFVPSMPARQRYLSLNSVVCSVIRRCAVRSSASS